MQCRREWIVVVGREAEVQVPPPALGICKPPRHPAHLPGHVVARVRRGEARKALDLMAPEAEQVVLRLMFADARHPEFELALWDATLPVQTGSPGEALRLGRRCSWR